MPKIVVVIEGGVVTSVLSTEDVEVAVIDYDTEGAVESEVIKIPQRVRGGSSAFADAYGGLRPVEVVPDRVEELFAAVR